MLIKSTRRFVYQYNGNERSCDVEEDPAGVIEMPAIGSLLARHDKKWKVVYVIAPVSPNGTIPVVRIFLNDIARTKARPFSPKPNGPSRRE
ncbi:MAG: hypothetical protein ACLGXA_09695 [Acidobacteriota bacterium]